jgi:hypothetical protein
MKYTLPNRIVIPEIKNKDKLVNEAQDKAITARLLNRLSAVSTTQEQRDMLNNLLKNTQFDGSTVNLTDIDECGSAATITTGCTNIPDNVMRSLEDRAFMQELSQKIFIDGVWEDMFLVNKNELIRRLMKINKVKQLTTYNEGCDCSVVNNNLINDGSGETSLIEYLTLTLSKNLTVTSSRLQGGDLRNAQGGANYVAIVNAIFGSYVNEILDADSARRFMDPTATQVVYGGNATAINNLATGDGMSADVINNGIALLKPKPNEKLTIYISTNAMAQLRNSYAYTTANLEDKFRKGINWVETDACPTLAAGATDPNETPLTAAVNTDVTFIIKTNPRDAIAMKTGKEAGSFGSVWRAWKHLPELQLVERKEEGCGNYDVRMRYTYLSTLITGCNHVIAKTARTCASPTTC